MSASRKPTARRSWSSGAACSRCIERDSDEESGIDHREKRRDARERCSRFDDPSIMTPNPNFLAGALDAAHRAADAAEAITLPRYRARDFSVETKADQTPVTEADREAEAAIRRVLRATFPQHSFYGEEAGREGDGDFLWLIDPVDGTKSFVRGYPFFSTQIALMHAGELVVGVSAAGAYGERMWATRGGGAVLALCGGEPRRVEVSQATAFDASTAISTGNLKTLASGPRWNALADLIGRSGRIRGYGDFVHY